MRWKELFWEQRDRVAQARCASSSSATRRSRRRLEPWPGITCKALIVPPGANLDARGARLAPALPPGASPRDLTPLPVFGYPGWVAQDASFYDDPRYFRTR